METLSREAAEVRRDTGIQRSAEHAERDDPGWADAALLALEQYCLAHPGRAFVCEEVREWSADRITAPANARAWGAVIRKAERLGVIVHAGYAPARSSHLSPKCRWKPA